jgi:hypothetical protein
MSFKIRPASLDGDREEMLGLMSRNFGTGPTNLFPWIRKDNPAGPCWSWLAYDSSGNGHTHAVAMVSVVPRHMRVNGKVVLAGQVGSFAVDPTHRSLGPAVMLQRTTFQPVDSGQVAFCYDCPPHDRGMSTFLRLGMKPDCEVYRYAFPLRVDDYIARKLGSGFWTKPVTFTGNVLLKVRRSPGPPCGIEIEQHDGLFGEEFDHIDATTTSAHMIRATRRARDLNFRYRHGQDDGQASSIGRIHVLIARRRGEIQAFAVYLAQPNSVAILLDLFGPHLDEAGCDLLQAIVGECRNLGMSSIQAFCSLASGLEPSFLRAGFRRRERNCRVVGYTSPSGSGQIRNGVHWAFGYFEVRA